MNSLADPYAPSFDRDARTFGEEYPGSPFIAKVAGRTIGARKEPRDSMDDDEDAHPSTAAIDDPVRMYLREIGRVRLLSGHEEVTYARAIRAGATATANARAWIANRITLQRLVTGGLPAVQPTSHAWA